MYRYGGLYVDTDVLFYRPLSKDIRSYDAVISKDLLPVSPFPSVYQNVVLFVKPGASFWKTCMESMKIYLDEDWLWNSVYQPYEIKERCPILLHVDPRLNTRCHKKECCPSFVADRIDWDAAHKSHLITGSMNNWPNDSYSIQYTYP